jgi:hypothetical protein
MRTGQRRRKVFGRKRRREVPSGPIALRCAVEIHAKGELFRVEHPQSPPRGVRDGVSRIQDQARKPRSSSRCSCHQTFKTLAVSRLDVLNDHDHLHDMQGPWYHAYWLLFRACRLPQGSIMYRFSPARILTHVLPSRTRGASEPTRDSNHGPLL